MRLLHGLLLVTYGFGQKCRDVDPVVPWEKYVRDGHAEVFGERLRPSGAEIAFSMEVVIYKSPGDFQNFFENYFFVHEDYLERFVL